MQHLKDAKVNLTPSETDSILIKMYKKDIDELDCTFLTEIMSKTNKKVEGKMKDITLNKEQSIAKEVSEEKKSIVVTDRSGKNEIEEDNNNEDISMAEDDDKDSIEYKEEELGVKDEEVKVENDVLSESPKFNESENKAEQQNESLKESNEEITSQGTAKKYEEDPKNDTIDKEVSKEELSKEVNKDSEDRDEGSKEVIETKKAEQKSVSNVNVSQSNTDEEILIELTQEAFAMIAEKMQQKSITEIFDKMIKTKIVEGAEIEIISTEDFIKAINSLDIPNMQETHLNALITVLSINEDHKQLKYADIVQILDSFDNQEEQTHKPLNIDSIDPISMIIMLALTEYLFENNIPLYDLLGDAVYQQPVKVDDKQSKEELIDSDKFFEILKKIGIEIANDRHKNLEEFLCIDQKYLEKLSIKKLKAAINEFAINKELRATAKAKYNEIAVVQESDVDDALGEGLNEKIQGQSESNSPNNINKEEKNEGESKCELKESEKDNEDIFLK